MPNLIVVVAAMFAAQTSQALVFQSSGVSAPVVAPDLGFAPQTVGVYVALSCASCVAGALVASRVSARLGSFRTLQFALVCVALGMLVTSLGGLAAVLAGALLVGAGAGATTPSTSQILARVTPTNRVGLVFSLVQTGMPVGLVLAGILIPPALASMHWRSMALILAIGIALSAVLLQPLRSRLDQRRAAPARSSAFLSSAGAVLSDPGMRRLAVIGLALNFSQNVFLGFTVIHLNLSLGLTLVAAGLIFSAAQFATVLARIILGWAADRMGSQVAVLLGCLLGAALSSVLLALIPPGWTGAASAAVIIFSVTAMGWPGVYLAAIAHYAPKGLIGPATALMMIFVQGGGILGPLMFSAAVSYFGSYSTGYLAYAGLALCASGLLILKKTAARTRPPR